ncbi:MAG: hypothetical protein WKF96_17785 [Solirubrobacteraceae bacterium]
MSDTIHTYPVGDLIDHDTEGGECPCGPTTTPVKRDDGSMGWLVQHHSLDPAPLARRARRAPPGQVR